MWPPMKLSNAALIKLINGIGAIQEVDFPVSASFALSQNTEALLDAYKPYAAECDKINAKYGDKPELTAKVCELQGLEVDVDLKTLPAEYLEIIVASPVRMAMVNLNALKHYIFNDDGETVNE